MQGLGVETSWDLFVTLLLMILLFFLVIRRLCLWMEWSVKLASVVNVQPEKRFLDSRVVIIIIIIIKKKFLILKIFNWLLNCDLGFRILFTHRFHTRDKLCFRFSFEWNKQQKQPLNTTSKRGNEYYRHSASIDLSSRMSITQKWHNIFSFVYGPSHSHSDSHSHSNAILI